MSEDGPWGGTFRVAAKGIGLLFNHMSLENVLWGPFEPNHMTLLTYGPDHQYHPYLASKLPTIETNDENPNVPKGQTRITYDIITNATWSDGMPITAEDVAFSMNYYKEAIPYGATTGEDYFGMTAAYAASPYRVVMEFDTISWWHSLAGADTIVMPKHILKDYPVDQWEEYQPYTEIPFVVSGPFEVTGFVPGAFLEMTARTDWAYGIDRSAADNSTTSTITNGGLQTNNNGILVGGFVGAASVIVGGFYVLRKPSAAIDQ
jgi:ABC-type transport system substrate-binding protein